MACAVLGPTGSGYRNVLLVIDPDRSIWVGVSLRPINYEVKSTGSEMVQWTPSASKANVVRAPN